MMKLTKFFLTGCWLLLLGGLLVNRLVLAGEEKIETFLSPSAPGPGQEFRLILIAENQQKLMGRELSVVSLGPDHLESRLNLHKKNGARLSGNGGQARPASQENIA